MAIVPTLTQGTVPLSQADESDASLAFQKR